MRRIRADDSTSRRLLVLDTSYSLEAIRLKQLEASVFCRDLSGYFSRVWSVHPFATLVTSDAWSPRYGEPETTILSERHTFIEGKVGRFKALAEWHVLNFVLAQIQLLSRLVRLARSERISAVRAGDPLVLGLYGWAISRICGIPFVVRVGGNNEKVRRDTGRPLMPRLLRYAAVERAIERFVLGRAHLVAAANEDNLQYALSMGARVDRSTVFRYGNLIHPIHFTAPADRRHPDELLASLGMASPRYALYIGRLERVKMPDHVVRALALIVADGCDMSLILVGAGSMQSELAHLAESLGVSGRVLFAGERDQQTLAALIPHAQVVLSPHTGRALTEAALGAAPVVAYDIDWQGELIRSGVTGALVPNGDVHAMARAALEFLSHPDQARQQGSRLREATLVMMDPSRLEEHERSHYEHLFKVHAVKSIATSQSVSG